MLRKLLLLALVRGCHRPRRVLGRHHSGDGAGERARRRTRRTSTNGKTMFYAGGCASCHATPGQDDKTQARRRARAEIAVRHVLCAEHLARSERRHRQLERGGFRHRDAEGHLAGRPALLSGVSLHVLPAHARRRRARPVRPSQDAAGRAGQGARPRRAVSVQHPPHARRLEIPVPRRQAVPARSVARPRHGIAAPIWSTAPAIAPNAIRRATCSAASSRASASPAGPNPEGEGWVPEHHAEGLERLVATRTSPSCSRPARRRTATRSAARWRKVDRATPSQLSRGGPRRDGGLHQVAAAGRRTEAAGEEVARTVPLRPRARQRRHALACRPVASDAPAMNEHPQGRPAQARLGDAVRPACRRWCAMSAT